MKPMLAVPGTLPRDDAGWSFELKWDGVRVIAAVTPAEVRLTGRSGSDMTLAYPELAGLAGAVGAARPVLDGEVVALRPDGRPDFQALAPRMHVRAPERARALAASTPVTYVVFDVLELAGTATIELPYGRRRELLESLEVVGPHWQVSPAVTGSGADVLEASRRLGLEGVVAKRLDSPYRPGRRSDEWLKIKNVRTQEVVIGGYTAGEGRRASTFGALLVGIPTAGGLAYAGSVGTGFDDRMLDELVATLRGLEQPDSPFVGAVDPRQARFAHWVRPELVGEVRFGHWTDDGRMRHPSWRGLRPDKVPEDVIREPQP
jgi:bifunctional non-homologous end joining protein LigD